MSRLTSTISTRDARFKDNAAAMALLTGELRMRLATAAEGGDERSRPQVGQPRPREVHLARVARPRRCLVGFC